MSDFAIAISVLGLVAIVALGRGVALRKQGRNVNFRTKE